MSKLTERLKYVRSYYNLSQTEMADHAGTTQQAIQQAETGKARQPRYLHRLAQSLSIPIDWMIFGEAVKDDVGISFSNANGLNDKSADILENFYAMPAKDQKLIYELMKARQKK